MTVLVEPVIQTLEAINDQEEGLPGVGLAELIRVLQQCGNMSLLTGDESAPELEAFADQLDLVEALFGSIEDGHGARLGELVSQEKHHRGLTGTRLAGEEGTG